jgi:hypothetical protein
MQLFVITSDYSKVPLAEIRTDGNNIDWVVDNTNGKLSRMSQGNFKILANIIDKSSHMNLEHPENSTVGLLRYSLENGDIIEITTDGKTAMLNGSLIAEEEKIALMSLIGSGKIKVKGKANPALPLPIRRMPKQQEKKQNIKSKKQFDEEEAIRNKTRQKIKEERSYWSPRQDKIIDSIDFSDSHCPELGRQLLYLMKYGD